MYQPHVGFLHQSIHSLLHPFNRRHLHHTEDKLLVKDILPQNEIFLKYFLALCSPVSSLKHNIYALFGRLKQYFTCFDCSIFLCPILLSSGIACPIIQAEIGVTA